MERTVKQITFRQVFWLFAVIAPLAKLVLLPSIASYYIGNRAYFLPLIYSAVDVIVILAVLIAEKTSGGKTFYELMRTLMPSWAANAFFVVYGAFFLVKALPYFCEQDLLINTVIYGEVPSSFVFVSVIAAACYGAFKGFNALLRAVELFFPAVAIAIVGLYALSFSACDFSRVFPIFDIPKGQLVKSLLANLSWGQSGVLYLAMMGKVKYDKSRFKLVWAFVVKIAISMGFYILIVGIFGVLAPRQLMVVSKISKYSIAFSNLGRLDFVFIVLLYLGMILFDAVYVAAAADMISEGTKIKRVYLSAGIGVLLFVSVYYLSPRFSRLHVFYAEYLPLTFIFYQIVNPVLLPVAAYMANKKESLRRATVKGAL